MFTLHAEPFNGSSERLGLHKDSVALTIDTPHKRFHYTQNPSRLRRSCCRKTFRPEILDPEQDRRSPELLQHDRRNSHRDGRGFIYQNQVDLLPATEGCQERGEDSKRKEIHRKAPSLTLASREQRHAENRYALISLLTWREETISWEKLSRGVIRHPSQNSDGMSTFLQPKGQIIDPKRLWPEILRDNQNLHDL